ncbi:MAG: efflux RND transporter periplasmic adaptor subunit [Acidobacteriota bacterium]
MPVEVAEVERDSISVFFETNGSLEAENEVDLVSRVAGPIVELRVEEGQRVSRGQVLARLDDRELRAQLASSLVRLEEAKAAFERTRALFDQELVSREVFDSARAASETAGADLERLEVQLSYTEITAPFEGWVVERYVKFAEFLQNGSRLFRLSDFEPLLCPIRVPERLLPQLRPGQQASLRVEAFGERVFQARVLRIRPVVQAATGTVEVTLEVEGDDALRPGMFASVALELARRENVVVVPKGALALDSLQPTVFAVAADGSAERRTLEIGFRNDRLLEVLRGLDAGETVVIVGQDGLAAGTPLEILDADRGAADSSEEAKAAGVAQGSPGVEASQAPQGAEVSQAPPGAEASQAPQGAEASQAPPGPRGEGRRRGRPEIDWDDPEQVRRIEQRMRERGLDDEQIERRLRRMRERRGGGSAS